jgi:RNA polymerase sigma-70 factor (ECF subfamily)
VKRKKGIPSLSLEEWMTKQMIGAALRLMHQNKKEYFVSSTVDARNSEKQSSDEISEEQIMKSADRNMILRALHQLAPSYRAVYNMHEVDGYSHREISKLLDISEFTSRDNLEKAKFNIRKNLSRMINK